MDQTERIKMRLDKLEDAVFGKKGSAPKTESVEKGKLPVQKGYILNKEEKVIRRIINQLMCNGMVDFSLEAKQLNMNSGGLKDILNYSAEKFNRMQDDGLVKAESDKLRATTLGMLLIRIIAKELDPNYSRYQKMFSKTI